MHAQLATGTIHHQRLPAPNPGRAPVFSTAISGSQESAPGVVFYRWGRRDPRPALPPLPGFSAGVTDDARLVAELAQLDLAEVLARMETGHRPYVAWIAGVPVAYGWSATRQTTIGEVGLRFDIPVGNRYLWDFATLPAWRGQGIYPRLLQAILAHEAEAARFWIGHVPANLASARGIVKAGFRRVGVINRVP
jgi:GNAT superfamily N-acetyltransferase